MIILENFIWQTPNLNQYMWQGIMLIYTIAQVLLITGGWYANNAALSSTEVSLQKSIRLTCVLEKK